MDAPPKRFGMVGAIRDLMPPPASHATFVSWRCRLGWHSWKRWTFARGDVCNPPQKDKQFRYCADCNYCDERTMGFYFKGGDAPRP